MSVSTMKKLSVVAPFRVSDALVRRLMRLRCVEIRRAPPDEEGLVLRHNGDDARLDAEKRVADVSAALAVLERFSVKPKPWNQKPIETTATLFRETGSYEAARSVVTEVLHLQDELDEVRSEYHRTETLMKSLIPWLDYRLPLETEETGQCTVFVGVLPPKTALPDFDRAFSDLHVAFEPVFQDETGLYVSVLFLTEEMDDVSRILTEFGFLRSTFKNLPVRNGTAREVTDNCRKSLSEAEIRIQKANDRLSELAVLLEDVQVLYDIEQTTLNAAVEKQKLSETESCVVLDAWIPAERSDRVANALNRLECAYEILDPDPEEEEPPVLLRNNGYASNFEWVVGMYSYPKYGTYDPTFLMSIFYFLIFGLMFADVGYGLILVLAGFLAPKILHMKDSMRRSLNMFGYCGISCVVLGVVFGGWFGDLPYAIMTTYMGYENAAAAQAAVPFFNGLVISDFALNPLVNPTGFLMISLAVGAVHLIAGMAVKFVILCKQHDFVAAVFDIGSWWVIFAGLGLLVVDTTIGLIVAGVGAGMLILMAGRAERNLFKRLMTGLKSLYDLINYASDLLSYSRILALGLAAGVIGQVVNLLATLGGPSVFGVILMILVLILGHAINLAINVLGSFVHTSRLQYLEFFGKFYEDGGVPFTPALPSDRFSTAELETTTEESAA